ncbi:hypothetical protein DHD32_06430 [Arenibacter sp. TNZ]|uniref:hypothetical protein n=1 Tax=Arenibacter TaxID=178469 RepID=UPI000CD4111A|nr:MULTISPECIES: hypothetical protein [Arenibacter]MCM4171108.1 hypothetical protein [Arenibacter sp. TNZ]
MSAISTWRDFSSLLRISHSIIRKQGNDINVGEEFTMRVTITNIAESSSLHSRRPNIRFSDLQVRISAGDHARPQAGNSVTLPLNDQLLTAGDSGTVDVVMLATGDLSFFPDIFGTEEIAEVTVFANLDQNAYFRIWNHSHRSQEIDN